MTTAVDRPLRVVVADDSFLLRAGVVRVLEETGFVVAGEARDAEELLAQAREHRPDVVVVDPRLPEVDGGVSFIAELRVSCPDTRILAMSWSDALERPAIDGGAHGFVRKTFRPTELIAAILAAGRAADA